MAFGAGTIWNFLTTGDNTNGGGFDTGNANMPTDLAATSATGDTPVVSSASYNFVASDVGHFVFIKSGTNWTPGWYEIASVADNAATLKAAIGEAALYSTTVPIAPNTAAGCATTASPTSGTWAMDYSHTATAKQAYTDLVIDGSVNTKITSAAERAFTAADVGNIINVTAGTNFTVQRIQIVSVAAGAATCDKAVGTTSATGGTGKLGGAFAVPVDALFELPVAGNTYWVKNGTYTFTENTLSSKAASVGTPISVIGYKTVYGDNPTGTDRPLFAMAAYYLQGNSYWMWRNIRCNQSGTSYGVGPGGYSITQNCRFMTTSGKCVRVDAPGYATLTQCELSGAASSDDGSANTGFYSSGGPFLLDKCYIHNCGTYGVDAEESGSIIGCIIVVPKGGTGIYVNHHTARIINNTICGVGLGQYGTGISTGKQDLTIIGNIFTGLATPISASSVNADAWIDLNNFYNNGADVSNVVKQSGNIALDPAFTSGGDSGSNLCTNGADWTGADGATPPTGWDVVTAGTFTITAGGQEDNYLKIAHNGVNNNPEISFPFSTTVGKNYLVTYYAQKGDATNATVKIGTTPGGSEISTYAHTDANWNTKKVRTFEATATTTYLSIGATTSTSGKYVMFDTVTIYEQGEDFTPGSNMKLDIDWTKMGC